MSGGRTAAAHGQGGGYLLLRRDGTLWGVANRDVESLARQGEGYRLQVAGRALAADEILGVVGALEVRPLSDVVRRFWPEAAGGWAVSGRLPVVLVDPRRPPRALELEGGELPHGD
jgi:hypothetical protein